MPMPSTLRPVLERHPEVMQGSADMPAVRCVVCGTIPAKIRTKKDGTVALPFRWIMGEEGPCCPQCKPAAHTRNYRYGAREPIGNLAEVRRQMHAAHRYHNALIAAEKDRRAQVHAVLVHHSPQFAVCDKQIEDTEAERAAVFARIKAANKAAQKRTATAEDRAAVHTCKVALRTLRQERKALMAALQSNPVVQQALAAVQTWYAEEQKRLQRESGIFWGTYLLVQAAARAATRHPVLRFHAWRGDGHLAVQIQGGMTVQEWLNGQHTQLQCHPYTVRIHTGEVRTRNRNGQYMLVKMRIGSVEREPVWADIPILLHRLPPLEARIKQMRLLRSRIGTREKWSVLLMVEDASFAGHAETAETGIAGVDVGWRQMPDGRLRVAMLAYTDDPSGAKEMALPAELLRRFAYVEVLRSTRDTLFNEAKRRLGAFLDARTPDDIPPWLKDRAQTLDRWHSTDRLASLVLYWREHRFPGDETIYPWLEGYKMMQADGKRGYGGWRKQDKHLLDHEAFQRLGATRSRNAFYREMAAKLARTVQTIRIEAMDLARDILRKPEVTDEGDASHRYMARIAAVGTLRKYLQERCATVEKIDPKDTTRTCYVCRHQDAWDPAMDLWHTCSQCGTRWDQDVNAAIWIRRGGVAQGFPDEQTESL